MENNGTSLKQNIEAYLQEAKMMQLATATKDGKPWVCNVWFAADSNLSIYWISATSRRHSSELSVNPYVAASICLVHNPNQSDTGALQIEGTAAQITDPIETAKALKLYAKRGIFTAQQVKKFMSDMKYPHRFYKLTPITIAYFKGSKQEYRPRIK